MKRPAGALRILQTMLHGLPRLLGDVRVIARLTKGAGWPRGGWLLAALPDGARRWLLAEGYEITEDFDGRVIVEPPAVRTDGPGDVPVPTVAGVGIAAPVAGAGWT